MAGPVSVLPPLEHPPSRPRLTPLSLAVFPRLATAALDLVFPALCAVCEARLGPRRRDPLCGPCWDAIDRIAPPFCDRCGGPCATPGSAMGGLDERGWGMGSSDVGSPERGPVSHPLTCARCAAEPPPYDYARSAAVYAGVMREAVHRFKFGGRRALARPLAELMVEQCGTSLPDGIAAIVPVPLAGDRERERGFNEAALLAERIARRLDVPVRARWLARRRATRPQSDLPAGERLANVRGAFRATPAVAGRHVLLVDDVLTTGATLSECARSLRAAAAGRIGVLTVARVR